MIQLSGETEKEESGWTVDTLKYYADHRFESLLQSLSDLSKLLDERYQTQTKATDAAFAAQQKAMETAFVAADRAVQTALESAEKAVTKAEMAAEKRFEATNEFRGQLSDQAQTLLSKSEYAAQHSNLVERVNELQDRMNRSEGKGAGYAALYGWVVAGVSVAVSIIVLAITIVGR